jgi:hypothetical protein
MTATTEVSQDLRNGIAALRRFVVIGISFADRMQGAAMIWAAAWAKAGRVSSSRYCEAPQGAKAISIG